MQYQKPGATGSHKSARVVGELRLARRPGRRDCRDQHAQHGTDAVAEQGLALMLAVARKIPTLDAQMKHGEWTTPDALMNGLNLCAANVVAFLHGQYQNRLV
jgi:hypothetical protein